MLSGHEAGVIVRVIQLDTEVEAAVVSTDEGTFLRRSLQRRSIWGRRPSDCSRRDLKARV